MTLCSPPTINLIWGKCTLARLIKKWSVQPLRTGGNLSNHDLLFGNWKPVLSCQLTPLKKLNFRLWLCNIPWSSIDNARQFLGHWRGILGALNKSPHPVLHTIQRWKLTEWKACPWVGIVHVQHRDCHCTPNLNAESSLQLNQPKD